MKVGNIVGGLEVIDVKRVNKMNLIQFTKAVSEYIDQGYKIDVNSSRQIGLVLQVDCYKLESNVSESFGSTGDSSNEDNIVKANELLDEADILVDKIISNAKEASDTTVNEKEQENLLTADNVESGSVEESVEEAKQALNTFTTPEQNDVAVQKKTRTKKTT